MVCICEMSFNMVNRVQRVWETEQATKGLIPVPREHKGERGNVYNEVREGMYIIIMD